MRGHQYQLVGVGSPVVDLLARVSDDYLASIMGKKGGMELIDAKAIEQILASLPEPPSIVPGGSAGNAAFAAARMGITTSFIGKIGNDELGRMYREHFALTGGDPGRFKFGNLPNGRCISLITPDSERTLRTNLGAAMTLTPDEISVTDFEGCRHAHIEGYILFNRDLMYKVLDSAKAAGCSISIDLASFEVVHASHDILESILADYIDIVFANEEEAQAFTGLSDDYPKMVQALGKLCSIAVVKLGAEGSLIQQADQTLRIDPISVDRAIDTTAAGDFWAAGFLAGWLSNKSLMSAGRQGSILGAAVVEVMGSALDATKWQQIRDTVKDWS